jgi:small-conductance mechanosensitive channel
MLRCYGRFRHGSRQFRARPPGFTALSQAHDEQSPAPEGRDRRADRWRELRSSLGLTPHAVRRARVRLLVFGLLFAGVIVVWHFRSDLFGLPECAKGTSGANCQVSGDAGTAALRIFVVVALLILGWQLARDIGRAFAPLLFGRMDPATAGTGGFLIRLVGLVVAVIVALRFADISVTAIAIGASASAVVIGLAAQQTLGNLIAGIVLLSARPFRVGDTVRLHSGQVGGQIEGVVAALGLMYTTLDSGGDSVLIPNSSVLAAAIRPLSEPEAVSVRARLRDGRTPADIERAIEDQLSVPVRGHPRVALEEVDGTDVVVTITVTPRNPRDGRRLASELLEVVTRETGADSAADGGSADAQTAR